MLVAIKELLHFYVNNDRYEDQDKPFWRRKNEYSKYIHM